LSSERGVMGKNRPTPPEKVAAEDGVTGEAGFFLPREEAWAMLEPTQSKYTRQTRKDNNRMGAEWERETEQGI